MEFSMNDLEFTSEIWLIILPLILCSLDVFTGYLNAWIKDEPSSKILRAGLGKKFGEIVYCILGWLLNLAFGLQPVAVFVTLYICLMEITSVLENCDKLGVKMPSFIKKKMNNLEEELNKKQ